MCYIASAYKIKDEIREDTKKAFVRGVFREQDFNDDGAGILAVRGDKVARKREMKIEKEDIYKGLEGELAHIHFRRATSGEVCEDNIHLWQIENWFLAHNGTSRVSKGKKGKADSLLFFEFLKDSGALKNDKIYSKTIAKLTDKFGLWGRFLIYNQKTKNTYYAGDWEVYLLNDELLVITSSETDFRESEREVWGLTFDDNDYSVEILESEIDDDKMFVINRDYEQIRFLEEGIGGSYEVGFKNYKVPEDKKTEATDCLPADEKEADFKTGSFYELEDDKWVEKPREEIYESEMI